jgi:curved DNA-binding protein CbpA
MNNRRNFYRILHVQPEAPLEIIKASYRSLMTKLKMHPDLGGDNESAALINQAYAVLSDPQKRRQYDESLQTRRTQGSNHSTNAHKTGFNTSGNYQATSNNNQRHSTAGRQHCLFCGVEFVPILKYCKQCASPLTAQPVQNKRAGELFGRRATPRVTKAGIATIYPSWPHTGYSARLRDLSPSGISLLTDYGARSGQILKLDSENLKAVTRVVSVRANGNNFSVHASFLTAEFTTKSGVFLTEKA